MIEIPIGVLIAFLVLVTTLSAMLIVSEYYYREMKKSAIGASEGWQRAIDGWARTQKLLEEVTEPKQQDWPDTIDR
jgi:Holliday junction resolvasome RuvABC endonuclease subunit